MVGGSVSGKTFKPDPSSYEATGIPCGNPRRYKNHAILRMVPDTATPFENQQLGAPGKGTQTEAEHHLKDLLKSQLETNVSLQSESRKRKSFSEPIVYQNSIEEVSGVLTLREYNKHDVYKQKQEEFTQLGLDQNELEQALTDYGFNVQDTKKRRYGQDPCVVEERRKIIEEKVRTKEEKLSQQTTFCNVKAMSRHAMEVERSLNRGTEKSNTLSHLVQSEDKVDPALEAVLREYNSERTSEDSYDHDDASERCSENDGHQDVVPLDEEVITRHRLTISEIREIPRFKDYDPGIPTEILYLKNLKKRVSESDLQALFNRFETQNRGQLKIQLGTRRMKGQAFVTFPNKEIATEAFALVNGYQLYGRPIIIEYGRGRKRESVNVPETKS